MCHLPPFIDGGPIEARAPPGRAAPCRAFRRSSTAAPLKHTPRDSALAGLPPSAVHRRRPH